MFVSAPAPNEMIGLVNSVILVHKTYRCYVIWGRNKAIIWAPLLLIVAGTGNILISTP